MKKKIKDLTIEELNEKFCKKRLWNANGSCFNCPLIINAKEDSCYRNVYFARKLLNENKDKIKELDNKEIDL